jgi:hypothetical protein
MAGSSVGQASSKSDPRFARADKTTSRPARADKGARGNYWRGGPRPDHRPPKGPKAELTPEQRRELKQFLAEHFPKLRDRAGEQRGEGSPRHDRMLRHLWPLYRTYQRNPELGEVLIEDQKLEFRIRQQARTIGAASTEEHREELLIELRDMLGRQFDLRVTQRRIELRELQEKLEAQERRLERFQRSRDKVIEGRMKRLKNEMREPGRDRRSGPRPERHRGEPVPPEPTQDL